MTAANRSFADTIRGASSSSAMMPFRSAAVSVRKIADSTSRRMFRLSCQHAGGHKPTNRADSKQDRKHSDCHFMSDGPTQKQPAGN
jgi:hypothetical protein